MGNLPTGPGTGPHDEDDQESQDESDGGEGMTHVYPCFGREHVVRFDCWCHPVLDWDGGCPIVVHTVHH